MFQQPASTMSRRLVLTRMSSWLAASVVGSSVCAGPAFAKDGSDDGSGDDRGGSDGSGSNSGPGSSSGSGSGPQSGSRSGSTTSSNSGSGSGVQTGASAGLNSGDDDDALERVALDILYADGFRERIHSGIYELTDGKGRRVIRRRATVADIARMQALAR
jgi:hypothetical protein